jgi:heat shock protein beta
MPTIYLRTKSTMEIEVEDDEDEDKNDDADDDKDTAAKEEEEPKEEDDLDVKEDDISEDVKEVEKPKKMKEVTTFDWAVMNGNPALWTRSKEDITDEEYQSFYEVLTKGEGKAETWTHFNAEGNINFKSILYIPKNVPQGWQSGMTEKQATGLSLYVRKVLISDEFELLPRYLYFMKGVVDSDDLPLNVNRETLQESKIIQVIKKKVVRKALEMLRNFAKESDSEAAPSEDSDDDNEDPVDGEVKTTPKINKYNEWYDQFNAQLKMGAIDDEPNRGKIMKLLRFKSTTSGGETTSLEKYVENMKDKLGGNQKEIFYVAGDGIEAVEKSQFLEPFLEKGVEVLYFVDPVDEYMASTVGSFDGKKMKNIATDNIKLDDNDDDKDLATRREKFYKEKFKPLTTWLKNLYGPSIMRVAISKRQISAPAIVSSAEYGHSANMERIMRAQAYSHGQNDMAMRSMKVFEINPRHPMILKLLESVPPKDAGDDYEVPDGVEDTAMILQEMALLNGGYPIDNPEGHSTRILKFLQSQLGLESLKLEPHPELPVEEEVAPDIDGMNFDDMDFDEMDLDDRINSLSPDGDGNVHIEL